MGQPINWFFRWVGNGYNSVNASTKEEALAKAVELGRSKYPGSKALIVDELSLVADPRYLKTNELDNQYRFWD